MLNIGILKKNQVTEQYASLITNFVCSVLGSNGRPNIILDDSYEDISNHAGDEKQVEEDLLGRSWQLVKKGANLIIIPHNGMIKHADVVRNETGAEVIIPAHAVAQAAKDLSIKNLALFSTRTIMNSGLMSDVISSKGLYVVPLTEPEKDMMDFIIRNVLMVNDIDSYQCAQEQITSFANRLTSPMLSNPSAGAIVLGCTELEIKLKYHSISVPVLGSINCSALDASNKVLASVTVPEACKGNMDLSNLLRLRDENRQNRVLKYPARAIPTF